MLTINKIKDLEKISNEITCLYIKLDFNHEINFFPNWITHLTFGENFNQPVDNLPNGLI